ncbi:hypothetical protein CPB85DRAFT_1298579 [Mucidula mucida]|nr:hypothetical protein CPB85DRAFT_1298579 [Mucidula mucida]
MSQTSCPTCGLLNGPTSFPEAPTSLRVLDLLSSNVPPHDAEVADLRQIVQNSSALVQSLQDHIDKTASRRLADAKRILHPIRSLPRDIYPKYSSFEAYGYGPEFDTLCPRNHPWNLSHVCRAWRQITLTLPRLWSTVYLNFERYNYLSHRQIIFKSTLLFERSANLDLAMTVASDNTGIAHHPMMGCLEASTTRWRTLHCRIPTSSLQALSGSTFPVLQELGIGYCHEPVLQAPLDVFRHVPNVRTVEFYHSECGINSDSVLGPFPWSNVKNLACYTFSIKAAFRFILAQASNIEELTLTFGVIYPDFFLANLISLPALRQINLTECEDADSGCIAEFLDALRVPAVRRLTLAFFPGQYVCFRGLNSHPDLHSITTLHVTCSMTAPEEDGAGDGVEMLLKFLRLTTGVEDFQLVDDDVSVNFLRAFASDGTETEAVSVNDGEVLNLPLLLLVESRSEFTDATVLESRPCQDLQMIVLPNSWNPLECSDDEHKNRWTAVNNLLEIVCI